MMLRYLVLITSSIALCDGPKQFPSHEKADRNARPFAVSKPLEDFTPPKAELVKGLLKDLGADSFSRRTIAHRTLEDLGEGLLNSPAFQQAIDSKDPEVRNRARAIEEKLRAPYTPIEAISLLRCLAKLANQQAEKSAMWRIAGALGSFTRLTKDEPLPLPEGQSNDYGNYNVAFERRVVALKKVLRDSGYAVHGDVGIVADEGPTQQRKISHRIDVSTQGQSFALLLTGNEVEMMPIVELGESKLLYLPINVDENRCFPEKRLPLGKLLPKGLKPGVLEDSQLTTTISVPLNGHTPEMSFTVRSKSSKQESGYVPCCGAKIEELVSYLFQANSENFKELQNWPHQEEVAIPRELFLRAK